MSRFGMTQPPAFFTTARGGTVATTPLPSAGEIISRAIGALEMTEALRAHAPRLVRETGSYVEGLDNWEDTREFLLACSWEEMDPAGLPEGVAQPGVRYLRARLGHLAMAYQNTITVARARERGLTLESRVHKPDSECGINPRGLGVFTDDRAKVQIRTNEVWIIVGQYDGHEVPYTWHPGAPAVPVTKAMYEALDAGDWDNLVLAEVNVHLPK